MSDAADILKFATEFNKLAKKWIQKAIQKPGRLHKHFGLSEDKDIPMGKLKSEYNKLKKKGG